jgi:dihydrofolate reductase
MRTIKMFNRVTPEGFFATADGSLNWVVPDDELDQAAGSSSSSFDTILFGRRTYEMFESFWPRALDDPKTSDPHRPGRNPAAMRDMATFINEAQKVVFSRTRNDVRWKNSRLVHEFVAEEIEALKNQPGKNMIIFGSGSIVSLLTEHGLIDEYQLVVSPLFLGSGRPLFDGLTKTTKLDLIEAKPYRSGNVVIRYARAK